MIISLDVKAGSVDTELSRQTPNFGQELVEAISISVRWVAGETSLPAKSTVAEIKTN
jgi:hypothetical protein